MSSQPVSAEAGPGFGSRLLRGLSYRNIGAIYVLGILVLIFGIWVPKLFLSWDSVKQIANNNAIAGLMALALVIPLCARAFDLSIAGIASLSGVVTGYMLAHGVGVVGAILLGMGSALLVGLINAIVVVVLGIDSFIGTLATNSLIQAFIIFVTGSQPIVHESLSGPFAQVAIKDLGGFALPVFYVLAVGLVIWFVLHHTASGRRFYATGFNPDAARLAGIRVSRLRFTSFLVSSTIAGFAGVVLAAQTSSGSSTAGDPYLLTAFAAAFVGATQLHAGRFNAWGTVIAVIVLGTLVWGLGLAGAPLWTPQLFTGAVLIAALAITAAETRGLRGGFRGRFGRKASPPPLPGGASPAAEVP